MTADKVKRLKHVIKRLLVMAALVYIGFGALLYVNQSSFIYHPTPVVDSEGLSDLVIQNADESIIINVLNEGQPKALIYFGGNAEAVAYNAPIFKQLFPDYTVYFMNYRGYGGSSGSPQEQSLYSDALALFDRVEKAHRGISVIGRSLGSGVATYLASQRNIEKLVLVTPFDSIVSVAAKHYPVYPVSIMLREHYNSIGRVPEISAPTLILIAGNDRVVDTFHGHKLAAAFPPGQVVKQELAGTGHNSITSNPQYHEILRKFL